MFDKKDPNLSLKCSEILDRFSPISSQSSQTAATKPVEFNILPKVGTLSLPPEICESFYKTINIAIIDFKIAQTIELKIKALSEMRAAINDVDVRTPADILAGAFEFHFLKSDLFKQIKQAYVENGVNSMAKDESPPIANILANMSPEKADMLMEILLDSPTTKLNMLYPKDDNSPEARAWQDFLEDHSIEFLGGNNSSNFKVSNLSNGSVNVLKVDNRLKMPRLVEQHLRNHLEGVFTPIHAERQVRGKNPEDQNVQISRTLLVTDFCPLGSLDDHQQSFQNKTKKYLSASIIMGQMTEAFKGIQNENCMFPDAKLTNWLLDSNGRIRVADTKSFLFTENGTYSAKLKGNEHTKILHTPGFITSEMTEVVNGRSTSLNVENLHASLLGRNIYTYLTNVWPDTFNFDYPIFQTKLGKEYKKLIKNLTKDPADQRMSLDDAQKELQELGMRSSPDYQRLMKKCGDLKSFVDNRLVLDMPKHTLAESIKKNEVIIDAFNELTSKSNLSGDQTQSPQELKSSLLEYQILKNEIAALKVGLQDEKMDDYLKRCDAIILNKGILVNSAVIQGQIASMKKVKAGLEKPENREVVNIINKYDEKKTEWFSRNMNVKARKIEEAMANIPIEKRAELLESKTPEVTNLLAALAWHRINPFAKPVKDGYKIEDSSSANTFKAFKLQFKKKFDQREEVVDPKKETMNKYRT